MDRKTILTVIFAGVLVIVLLFIGFYSILGSSAPVDIPEANVNAPVVNTTIEEPSSPTAVANINTPPAEVVVIDQEAKEKADMERMAISFVERYGSFSNQSNFENMDDLKVFMTQSMKNWVDKYIKEQKEKRGDTSIYYGMTTKSLSTSFVNYRPSSGQAEILVVTQRREATGTTTNQEVYTQEATLKFAKENNAWKVDGIYWK